MRLESFCKLRQSTSGQAISLSLLVRRHCINRNPIPFAVFSLLAPLSFVSWPSFALLCLLSSTLSPPPFLTCICTSLKPFLSTNTVDIGRQQPPPVQALCTGTVTLPFASIPISS